MIRKIEMNSQVGHSRHDVIIKLITVFSLEPALFKFHEELDNAISICLSVIVVEEDGVVDEGNRAAGLLGLAGSLMSL